jgi:hypothetical protein
MHSANISLFIGTSSNVVCNVVCALMIESANNGFVSAASEHQYLRRMRNEEDMKRANSKLELAFPTIVIS